MDFTNIGQRVRACSAKKLAILAIFRFFFVPETPKYPPPNVKFGTAGGPSVPSAVPNFTLIRE